MLALLAAAPTGLALTAGQRPSHAVRRAPEARMATLEPGAKVLVTGKGPVMLLAAKMAAVQALHSAALHLPSLPPPATACHQPPPPASHPPTSPEQGFEVSCLLGTEKSMAEALERNLNLTLTLTLTRTLTLTPTLTLTLTLTLRRRTGRSTPQRRRWLRRWRGLRRRKPG